MFRKFMEAMQLEECFREETANAGVSFVLTRDEEAMRSYVEDFRVVVRSLELAPTLFDELQADSGFARLLEAAGQLGTYEYDRSVACLRFLAWHRKKLDALIRQLRRYKDEQKLVQHRHVLSSFHARALRALEQV